MSLKIFHNVPDLDELASKHQDFDALMNAHTDEKIRRRRKLRMMSSFALVVFATAFLSWLYWGYEAEKTSPVAVPSHLPQTPTEQVIPIQEETDLVPVTEAQKPGSVEENEPEQKPIEKQESVTGKTPIVEPEEELASPKVTITQLETADAAPAEGLENLYRYLYSEIHLPDSLLDESNTLFLEVAFTVGRDGSISEVSFNKDLPDTLVQKLKSVFEKMPVWKPALEKGDSIASVINLPITFQKKPDQQ
jgi:hypothetical protein